MRHWILILIVAVALAAGTLSATEPDAKQLALKGLSVFHEVLGGDEAKLTEALRYMEESRAADGTYIANLYNLGRAYFYEAITHNRPEAVVKAEEVFAKIMELDSNRTEALAFHGSVLTILSQGRDITKFMQGIQEMKTAIDRAPKSINNRIVLAFTSRNFPPQALAAMGNYDALGDFEMVNQVFDGNAFSYAPHAEVVMKAFVGEAYKQKGENEKSRAMFEAALAVPKPTDAGKLAGRELLDAEITKRMDGGTTPLFRNRIFAGCHSCHLNAPDKLMK